jgi:O-antigen/teichoic acid export membrane protein
LGVGIKNRPLSRFIARAPQPTAAGSWFNRVSHSQFFRRAAGTYGTQLVMAVLSLVSGVVVARALGPEGRGAYAVALVIVLIGVQVGGLGLQGSNTYFVARNRTLLATLLSNSLLASVVVGGLGWIIFWVVFHVFHHAQPLDSALMALALAGIPVGLAYLLAINLLMGLQEVRFYNAVELLNKVLSTGLVIAIAWLTRRSPWMFFLVVLAAQAVSLTLAVRVLMKLCDFQASPSMAILRQSLRLGWKIYLSCLFGFLVIRIDLLMVRYMLGESATGFYSVAGNLGDFVLMLPVAIGALLFPKLSALQDEKQKRLLTLKATAATGVVLVAILLVLGLSVKFVVVLLFGKAFAPASTAVLLLAPGVLFLGLEGVLVQYLNSCGFPVSVMVFWIVSTLLNVGLNLWAIPAYGINGAAAVSSFSYLLMLVGVAWMTLKRWTMPQLYNQATGLLQVNQGAQQVFASPTGRAGQRE